MLRLIPTLLCVLCIACAVGRAAQPAQDDKDKIQGAWTVTSFEVGRQAEKEMVGVKLKFAGDKVTAHSKSGEKGDGTFTLNTAKKPKELDMDLAAGKEKLALPLASMSWTATL